MRVGFVGLGNMGSGMARNLIKAGHTLRVYNRTRSRAESLQSLGATIAATPGEAASDAEALITMLADDRAVEDVVFAPGNALQSLPAGAVHISMSTISVALSRRLAAAHREKQQHYVAAPVFGRPEAAAAAKLFIVAAGPADQIERCRPLFEAMGQKTFLTGEEAPAANVIKLAGNFLISTVIESLAEAFALVRKFGLDPNAFLEVLTNSLFQAPAYRNYGSMIAAGKFEPVGFKLTLGLKDNRLLLAAAEEVCGSYADGQPCARPICGRPGPGAGRSRLGRDRSRFPSKRRTLRKQATRGCDDLPLLFERCQFAFQLSQSFTKNFLVPRVASRLQVLQHSGAREMQSFFPSKEFDFSRAHAAIGLIPFSVSGRLDLRFNGLAFPSSRHLVPTPPSGAACLLHDSIPRAWRPSFGMWPRCSHGDGSVHLSYSEVSLDRAQGL